MSRSEAGRSLLSAVDFADPSALVKRRYDAADGAVVTDPRSSRVVVPAVSRLHISSDSRPPPSVDDRPHPTLDYLQAG